MKLLQLFLFATLVFLSCKKQDTPPDNNNNNNNPVVKGTVIGKVVTPNNKTAVRNAVVFIADGATIYHTYTDVNGAFSLKAPAGQWVLNIQSGTGKIFRTTLNVSIEGNKTTDLSSSALKLTQVATLAVVPGTYDKIEAILIDSLGYSASIIGPNDLHFAGVLSNFNAVFINCSSNIMVDYVQDSVLANYVANGGSLYVSDWAVATLIGTSIGTCGAPRPGGFIPDSKLCTHRSGFSGMINNAHIVSSSLQTYLNKTQMDVKYDLGSWEMVQNYDSSFWEVMVKHPATNAPLLVRTTNFTNSSAGTISIGAANNNMITICHKPQGSVPITITIPVGQLAAHLAHGDSVGSCQSANGAGRIYFTTFHTEPNGQISPDMKHILDYIILNL
jgi:hypothetical protein